MKQAILGAFFVAFSVTSAVVHAQSLSEDEEQRFDPALLAERVALLNDAQVTLALLTDGARDGEAVDLYSLPLPDWEMQNIALPNAIIGIEGTVRAQSVQIAGLQLNLLRLQGASSDALALAEARLMEHQAAYEAFVANSVLAD